ncbi:hypothetical protein SAMN05421820_108273 [Pedobacter steynii]|uniref:Uncharacterized protein n=1 Tax=Pedobacter steynii TaxID=430522 RepID=A0A1H0D0P1_9SPHI|nr:hypothetical protein SAMN05421820_108273 [Pedobacter steynii]
MDQIEKLNKKSIVCAEINSESIHPSSILITNILLISFTKQLNIINCLTLTTSPLIPTNDN